MHPGNQVAGFVDNGRSATLGRAKITRPNLVSRGRGQPIAWHRPLPPLPTEGTSQRSLIDISGRGQPTIAWHRSLPPLPTEGTGQRSLTHISTNKYSPSALDGPSFSCNICLERHPEEDVAYIEKCGHLFCRESIRTYIASKLSDRRFPIVCPSCDIATGRQYGLGMVTETLALQVGISEEQFAIWNELELVDFFITIYCRGCLRTAAVDRQDHDEATILICPLPGCNYSWCKSCQQQVALEGPPHSCDGSLELENLIHEKGWRRCPGMCKTPIQKSSGCDHMTCNAPGCNSHFCYRCGKLIIKSTITQEINTAVNEHYHGFGACSGN